MRSTELTKRNIKEVIRDPLSLGIAVALPLVLLLTLQALGGDDTPFLTPTLLTPGIVLFGFVMVMFSSAMVLSRVGLRAKDPSAMAVSMRGSSCITTRPAPRLRWPTSELPICPSGSPTSPPEVRRKACGQACHRRS